MKIAWSQPLPPSFTELEMLLLATVMLTGKFRLCINYFDISLSLDLKEGDGSGRDKKGQI